jgi:hypothetical protein
MLRPPLPITRTFFTSTRFCAPAIAPLLRYACALGACCVWFHVVETFEKARSCCRKAAGESRVARKDVNDLAVRDVKVRHDAEGATERYWLVRAGARRANREQRAMFAGGHAAVGKLEARQCRGGLRLTRDGARKKSRPKLIRGIEGCQSSGSPSAMDQ